MNIFLFLLREAFERYPWESDVAAAAAGKSLQSCPTLCDPMKCNMPGFPVHHQLPKLTQTHVHWVGNAIQPSHPVLYPFSSCFQSFPASESFPMSQFFSSGGQSTGASASASVLPMNIQGWFPLGWTGLVPSSPRDSQEPSPAPQFESINSSMLSFFYGLTFTFVLEKS